MPTSSRGGATAPRSRRAPKRLVAKVVASRAKAKSDTAGAQQREYGPKPSSPVLVPRAHAADAVKLAKQVIADPHASREQKRAAATAAYHAARRSPKVLEANVIPAKGAERIVGQTLLDLSDAAIHSPGGAVAAGRAVAHDVGQAAHGHPDFKHSRAIAAAMAKGTVEDLRHPLRHPGFTALDLFAALSAGAGTAARVGAVGKAARAGELGTAAKALVKAPAPGTRTYRHGDLEVETPNSKNALVRGLQKAHAQQVNKTGDEGRQAKVVGKHLTQHNRVVTAVERSGAEALAARGRPLSTPQETALRAVEEETPLETTIAMHERELATAKKGSQKHRDLRQKILLARAAQRYVENVGGKPQLKAEFKHFRAGPIGAGRTPKRLAEVSGRIEDVAAQREQTLIDAGKLDPEGAAHRKSAPGRIARGATYEKPTPAKMGVPSKGLVRQRAVVAELEKRHEQELTTAAKAAARDHGRREKRLVKYDDQIASAREKGQERRVVQLEHERDILRHRHEAASSTVAVKVPGGKKTVTRDMSLADAETRLAELDKTYEATIKKIEPHVDPYQGDSNVMDIRGRMRSVKQEEQRFRNMKSGKGGAGARYHEKQKSVGEEVRALAENKLNELGGETNGKPAFGKVTSTVKTKSSTKHVPSDVPVPNVASNPSATRYGGALSLARERLDRMEAAAAKRRKPVGIVGAEDFEGGRSRVPYSMEAGKKLSPVQTSYRGGEPRKPGSLTNPYTGALQRSGGYRTKSSRLVAESALEAQKYTDTLRLRDKVLKGSREDLPAENAHDYIAVRVGTAKMPPELKNLEGKIEEGVKLSREERQLLADSFDTWKQDLFAEPTTLKTYKGYRFVRRELLTKANQPRLLANVAHYRALRGVGHVVSETNNAVRTALLYLAPKYAVPNIGGNIFLNVSQQGWRAPHNFYRTLTVVDRDPDLAAKFRSAMGEGFVKQLAPASGLTRKASEPLAQMWSKLVDEKFRESALHDELGKLGFKSRSQLHAAFEPQNEAKMVEAIQRAREAIGDYDRLGAVEKDVVRHAIFFYTWLKVSARLSKMFLVDRPIQSAALANLGKVGEQKQREELGSLPSFAEPLFKIAGSKEHPVVSNASALNVFTAADLTKALINFARGEHNKSGYQIADNLSPFFSLAVASITGRDPFTQQQLKGNIGKVALEQLTGGLPQVALKQRLDRAKTDQSDKFYSYTSGQAKGQFFLGPLGPRGMNPDPAHQLADKEHLADVPPAQRSRLTVFKRRQSFYEAMKQQGHLEDGRMPQSLRDAFNIEAARQSAYTGATDRVHAKPGSAAYHVARFKVDAHLLLVHGQIDRAEAHQMIGWANAHAHDSEALKAARRYVSDHYYQADNGFLTLINESKKYLEEHGAKNLG